MDLTAKSVVFIFTGEFNAFESLEDNLDTISWLSKHGFDRNADMDPAFFFQKFMLITKLS